MKLKYKLGEKFIYLNPNDYQGRYVSGKVYFIQDYLGEVNYIFGNENFVGSLSWSNEEIDSGEWWKPLEVKLNSIKVPSWL